MLIHKKYWSLFAIVPLTLIFSINFILFGESTSSIEETVLNMVIGQVSSNDNKVMLFIGEKLYYLIFFNLLFGGFISEQFNDNAVYIFSRIKNRKKWFYKRATQLLAFSAVYSLIFVSTLIFIGVINSNGNFDGQTMYVICVLIVRMILLIFFTTLAINLLSVRYDSIRGFIIVYVISMILIFIAIKYSNSNFSAWIHLLNPMSGFIFPTSNNVILLVVSLIYYVALIIILMIIGAAYINRYDITETYRES